MAALAATETKGRSRGLLLPLGLAVLVILGGLAALLPAGRLPWQPAPVDPVQTLRPESEAERHARLAAAFSARLAAEPCGRAVLLLEPGGGARIEGFVASEAARDGIVAAAAQAELGALSVVPDVRPWPLCATLLLVGSVESGDLRLGVNRPDRRFRIDHDPFQMRYERASGRSASGFGALVLMRPGTEVQVLPTMLNIEVDPTDVYRFPSTPAPLPAPEGPMLALALYADRSIQGLDPGADGLVKADRFLDVLSALRTQPGFAASAIIVDVVR